MPKGKNTPVFMVDTLMAFSGAVVGPLKKTLSDKGYDCFGAIEIIMPNNWLTKKINNEKNRKITEKGLAAAEKYALNLLAGKTSWNRIPFLSKFFYYLCCNKLVMHLINVSYGKKICVNKDKCIKCGICANLCPKNNISMSDYPEWNGSCELCTRCLNLCPKGAVNIPGKPFVRYRAETIAPYISYS